ncbi:hypothetical protein NYP20_14030 [Pseudomonas sp. N3-W]|uniref:hypothetical protein n=1 Tax=Pseudomonas sp. N3-W TaxID=2975049 RepID=UPI00217CD55E|nr:hypothetical protein [Pseudomonas sp. N3-W]UWF52015.1 hypothetical protein NYP20_14030 [Pseudomonas sp. N3-W]
MRTVNGTGEKQVGGGTQTFSARGFNYEDRANKQNSNHYINQQFASLSVILAQSLKALKKEGDRSAFSCAEAHAVSQLLAKGVAASTIRLTIATDSTGHELVIPCDNCSEWLDLVDGSGFGADRTYLIKPSLLPSQNASSSAPTKAPPPITDEKAWPALK